MPLRSLCAINETCSQNQYDKSLMPLFIDNVTVLQKSSSICQWGRWVQGSRLKRQCLNCQSKLSMSFFFLTFSYSKFLAVKWLNQNLIFTLLSTSWDEIKFSCESLRQNTLKDYLSCQFLEWWRHVLDQ